MNILLIDDQSKMREMFSKILQTLHHQVAYLSSGLEALKLSDGELQAFDVIFIDMIMPEMDGCRTGLAIKERFPDLVTIMLTVDSSIKTVIRALRDSKFDDYLYKTEVAKDACIGSFKLQETLLRAQTLMKTRQELRQTQNALTNEYQLNQVLRKQGLGANKELIGTAPSFQKVLQLIQRVAPSPTTVLIQGETGTGKELVARAIHKQSLRAEEPFIPINCGAIPKELLESELFGHRRGAFTGASSDREGLFQIANGGTLFLDEIGDMPLELQVKLLRVLQEQEILPIGEKKPIKIDVRIISATHQNLEEKIGEKAFREDLFYRLNVFPIRIPPLRERSIDIALIAQQYIAKKAHHTAIKSIGAEALALLQKQPWKGNVRELENVLERVLLIANGETLVPEDFSEMLSLPQKFPLPAVSVSAKESCDTAGYEKLWETFVENDCKLWKIVGREALWKEMHTLFAGSIYQKKGHFGQLKVAGKKELWVELEYVNGVSCEMDSHTIEFEFLSQEDNPSFEKEAEGFSQKEETTPGRTYQLVLKGLPDTYIFDILYPPAKRNDLNLFSQQQLIRATILRYAQTFTSSKNLKGIFEHVMELLIDSGLQEQIRGLDKDGLEAMRACLCSKSHIFPRIASQLKVNPVGIEQEIQKIFPDYEPLGKGVIHGAPRFFRPDGSLH